MPDSLGAWLRKLGDQRADEHTCTNSPAIIRLTMADSIARTSDVSGEPWSPLTLHSVWAGVRRLDDIQAELVISRKVLTERLSHSVEHGVVDRETYDHRPRLDYGC
jgi:DNA-binding HxlR family transcriptional regulator